MVPTRNAQSQLGFTKFPNALFGKLKSPKAAVYLALYRHAGMDHGARPTIERVMTMTGMKRSAVKAAIVELQKAGLITSTRRGARRPNLYTFAELDGTFTKVPNDIWRAELDPEALMLWVALAELADLPEGIFPTVQELATKMRASKSTVTRATQVLIARRLLKVTRDDTASGGLCRNHYQLVDISTALTWIDDDVLFADQAVLDPTITGTQSDHHRYSIRPSPVLNPTIGGTQSDHEEDSLNKTHQEDSLNQTHYRPPQAADEGQPVKPELPVGQEVPGDNDPFLDSSTPGPQDSGTPVLALSPTLGDDLDSCDTQEDPDWWQALRTVSGRHPGKPQDWIELIAQNELKRLKTIREYRERQEAEVEAQRHPRPRLILVG